MAYSYSYLSREREDRFTNNIREEKRIHQFDRHSTFSQSELKDLADNSQSVKQLQRIQLMADQKTNDLSSASSQHHRNETGLPNNLKSGIERLSGYSMDDVKVHYNSDKPAQLNAHAYAQGTQIHIASGQEKHLPHEAWHVVQQKQGRVVPTMQLKGKIAINDNAELEQEATVMGGKALQLMANPQNANRINASPNQNAAPQVVQRALAIGGMVNLGANDQAKLADVIRIANAAHGADAALGAGNIDVDIHITSPGRREISPAVTYAPVPKVGGGSTIRVDIQRAYVELATVGELLGMIAHEVGVHGYVNALGHGGLAALPALTAIPSARPGRAATGYVLGAQGRHVSRDHLEVTQSLIGPAISARANKYVETILNHGNAIEADAHLTPAEKLRAQGDLISSYCFDIARIVATDDRMAYVPFHWDAIYEVYAATYAFLQAQPAFAALAWFAAAPLKPANQLKPDFNSLGASFVWNKIKGR